jgi:alanine racemase
MLLRNVPTGTPLSYGGAFVTLRDSLIATIPVGYADGYRRGLGGKGEVIVRGKRAPVVGRVCMDLTLVDVTDVPGVREGDEIVLIGRRGGERISVEDLASKLDTISYEILCGIGKRVPRIYEKLNA